MHRLLSMLAAPLLLLLSACGPARGYLGPELSRPQVALLKGDFKQPLLGGSSVLGVMEVDSLKLVDEPEPKPVFQDPKTPKEEVFLTPGVHRIKVKHMWETGSWIQWKYYWLEGEFKAGYDYQLGWDASRNVQIIPLGVAKVE